MSPAEPWMTRQGLFLWVSEVTPPVPSDRATAMNAPQVPPRARAPRQKPSTRRRPSPANPSGEWLVLEVWIKIIAQVILSIAAIGAIAKLIPYQQVQQAKLEEVRLAVSEKEARVNELREQFSRNFDPKVAKQVMGEQSPRRDPNQRRIFWVSQ